MCTVEVSRPKAGGRGTRQRKSHIAKMLALYQSASTKSRILNTRNAVAKKTNRSDTSISSEAKRTARNGEVVWRPFVDGLRAFVAQRVPEADAKDVLQETLVQLHEGAPTLRDEDRAEAWVFSIARREIANYYRQKERRPIDRTVGAADDVSAENVPSTENIEAYEGEHSVHEEVLSWLRPMAEKLPKPYRRALIMADFEGKIQQQVADELGLSLSGAKSRVQRARAKLGARLKRCCAVEFGPGGRAVEFRRRISSDKEDS